MGAIEELEKWRKYNKRVLKRTKREGVALYERCACEHDRWRPLQLLRRVQFMQLVV